MDQSQLLAAGGAREALGAAGWRAELELDFGLRQGKTSLLKRRHFGPLLVQRAFYPESPQVAHVYLLHPPGGIVGGDGLHLDVAVRSAASALLTTPGATKLYRSPGRPSRQTQCCRIGSGGTLEWFPQETILFSGAESTSCLTIDLETDGPNGPAQFMGWETVSVGRHGAGERFASGRYVSKIRLHADGEPLLLERLVIEGGAPFLQAPWGLRGAPISGSFIATALGPVNHHLGELVETCREWTAAQVVDCPGEWRGVSALNTPRGYGGPASGLGLFVGRYLGASVERARAWMIGLWRILRPVLLGREACVPRIWAT